MADIMNDHLRARLDEYTSELFVQEDETLRWIQEQATAHQLPAISVRPFEGRLLQILVALTGAKTVVEIGALAWRSAWNCWKGTHTLRCTTSCNAPHSI